MRRGGLRCRDNPKYRDVPRRSVSGTPVREITAEEFDEFTARVNAIREARITPSPRPPGGIPQELRESIERANRGWDE
jgi:hypothetical protein